MDYQKHYWDCLDHNMKLDAQIKQLKIERDEARAWSAAWKQAAKLNRDFGGLWYKMAWDFKLKMYEARTVAKRLLNDPTYLHRCYQRAGLISEDINWDDIEMITADVVKRAFG